MQIGSVNNYSSNNTLSFQKRKKEPKNQVKFEYDFWEGRYVEQPPTQRTFTLAQFLRNPIRTARKKAQALLDQANQEAVLTRQSALEESNAILTRAKEEASGLLHKEHDHAIASAKISAREEIERIKKKKEEEIENTIQWQRFILEQKEAELQREHEAKIAQYKSEEEELQRNLESTQALFDRLRRHSVEEEIADIKAQVKEEIDSYQLDYDYSQGLQLEDKYAQQFMQVDNPSQNISIMDCAIPKTYKVEEKPLEIPNIEKGMPWEYQVPQNGEIKLPEYKKLPFTEMYDRETNISMNYADSVMWGLEKISRDILQNFFDGHGQTLDGVKMNFTPQENGKWKVRIEGQAQYTQEKAILLGESTKRNNSKAAGNFGEGLKIVVLKLLKNLGAEEVSIGSDDWKVLYKAKESQICQKEVLSYSLLKEEPIEGNYIEFETDNFALLECLRQSINNFYHSNNTDFQNFDFENDKIGIKLLPENENGSLYISGQKFEFGDYSLSYGDWRNVPGCTIAFKEKPRATSEIDISRDRLKIGSNDLKKLIASCIYSEKTSTEEIGALLKIFHKQWKQKDDNSYHHYTNKAEELRTDILKGIIEGCCVRGIKFDFPSAYLAGNKSGDKGVDYFYSKTHTVCLSDFAKIGMQSTHGKACKDRDKVLVEPNAQQIKKIGIIKKTIECLKPSIYRASRDFNDKDLNPNIYIFDEKGPFAGEHRKDGFWISGSELNNSFDRVMSTALHEICHKMGGDGALKFTYALTDMLHAVINTALKDKDTLLKLKALKSCWDEINYGEYQF